MLSVTLNEAFELRDNGGLIHAREQVGICADLFDLLAVRLLAALRAMEEHGRHFGTLPNVAALNPDFFRGETAQRNARKNTLVSKLLFSARSSLFHKLAPWRIRSRTSRENSARRPKKSLTGPRPNLAR